MPILRTSLLRAVASLPLAVAFATGGGAQSLPVLSWESITLSTLDGRAHELQRGRLEVPESRASPMSPTITVGMLRLPSTNPRPGSPTVFLMGGPGVPVSAIAAIPPYWALFDSLRTVGDVILLDPRGVGLSTPTLDCPAGPPPDAGFLRTRATFIAAYRSMVARCVAHFSGRGSSARALTDFAIADDLDDLRRALRVDRISLLGFSYGTRLALTYARRHPDGVDRLVLQGPTDADGMYRAAAWHDSLFRMIAREAAMDSVTSSFAQDLLGRTEALLARSAATPIAVRLGNAAGDSITVPVGRDMLAATITGRIADPRIPALIATLEQGDVSILRMWVGGLYMDLVRGGGSLMARAATCSQVPSGARTMAVDVIDGGTIFGPMVDNFTSAPDFCSAIGGDIVPDRSRRPRLNRPVLLIVGSRDDRTPPANAAMLSAGLRNATTLLVEQGGHELLPEPAVQRAVVAFLRGAALRERRLTVPPPRYLSIDDARQPPRRPGR
jgi:pimeloyl-ACP methyl ester carboxylesterase